MPLLNQAPSSKVPEIRINPNNSTNNEERSDEVYEEE